MGGGLMQLTAYGSQDIYITGNPQITFFKAVFRRHTNFSVESIEQTISGTVGPSGRVTTTITRNGDLLYRLFYEVAGMVAAPPDPSAFNRPEVPTAGHWPGVSMGPAGDGTAGFSAFKYYGNPGALIFKHVDLEIGGQRIDRQTGQWMQVSAALTQKNDARLVAGLPGYDMFEYCSRCLGPGITPTQTPTHPAGHQGSYYYAENPDGTPRGNPTYARLDGGTLFQELTGMGGTVQIEGLPQIKHNGAANPGIKWDETAIKIDVTIPLQFWFCRNPGLAIPLIALQYHQVKLVTSFSSHMPAANTTKLWADYIYLDDDERRRFAQVSHEYLIEQVQFQPGSSVSAKTKINFNHPVKELIWTGGFNTTNATGATFDGIHNDLEDGDYEITLNGHKRLNARPLSYFTKQQVSMHHTGPGDIGTVGSGPYYNFNEVGGSGNGIAVYSFALKPEEHQPSGTCNFSRIDNAQITGPAQALDVFAVNYNVLRIMSGMGGLAYSN